CAVTDDDVVFDDGERANDDVISELGFRTYDRCIVYGGAHGGMRRGKKLFMPRPVEPEPAPAKAGGYRLSAPPEGGGYRLNAPAKAGGYRFNAPRKGGGYRFNTPPKGGGYRPGSRRGRRWPRRIRLQQPIRRRRMLSPAIGQAWTFG